MAKTSQQQSRRNSPSPPSSGNGRGDVKPAVARVKRTRKSVPRESPLQRSSMYRGVTRHRWTGRYEAHLWDKNCWNESQNKKGRQVHCSAKDSCFFFGGIYFVDDDDGDGVESHRVAVYLGAYDDEEAAAHAYDLAALKYWGPETVLNFPLSTYQEELKQMEGHSREEYIGSLRRKSNGFSRGVSKYRGVARHHHNGRWEARIGRVFGNKYLYLGTYATQEEAAMAYDMAAIEYRGLNAVTNFDLSRYIKWLRPKNQGTDPALSQASPDGDAGSLPNPLPELGFGLLATACKQSSETTVPAPHPGGPSSSASSALGLLLQSSKFKEMLESTSAQECPSTPSESDILPRRSFPDDIQTYFDCQEPNGFVEGDDGIFGDLDSFALPMFNCELES